MEKIKVSELLRPGECRSCDIGPCTSFSHLDYGMRLCLEDGTVHCDWHEVEIDWQDNNKPDPSDQLDLQHLADKVENYAWIEETIADINVRMEKQGEINKASVQSFVELEQRVDAIMEATNALVADIHVRLDEKASKAELVAVGAPKEGAETVIGDKQYFNGMKPTKELPPMPKGYLVVPEPAGRVITETMMHTTCGLNAGFATWQYGTQLHQGWNTGQIIDIASDVLPEPPEGTHLHEVDFENDVWEEGDRPKSLAAIPGTGWSMAVTERETGSIQVGVAILTGNTNQGYICRADKVNGMPSEEELTAAIKEKSNIKAADGKEEE